MKIRPVGSESLHAGG